MYENGLFVYWKSIFISFGFVRRTGLGLVLLMKSVFCAGCFES